jgi:hypothetical protein
MNFNPTRDVEVKAMVAATLRQQAREPPSG